jgi:methionyl-tRNA formyltransferase
MRIAYFHNWTWLGAAVGRALLDKAEDDLWLIGGPSSKAERDPELIERAKARGALCVVPDVASETFARRLEVFAPDLIIVGTFSRKLSPRLLAIPRLAAINIHSSLLPKYRGALPEFWVIRHGEKETGVTIHHMTETFDAGNILAQVPIGIAPAENLLTLSISISQAAVPLVNELLECYREGERPTGVPQDHREATAAPMVRAHHLEVHWNEAARSIECLTRAAYPFFEPHTTFRGERLVIRSAFCPLRTDIALEPGRIFYDRSTLSLLAGTGDGLLALSTVEQNGEQTNGWRFAERNFLATAQNERFG